MDSARFDSIIKSLASGVTRRKAFTLVAGVLAGGALSSDPERTEAAPQEVCYEGFCGTGSTCCGTRKAVTCCGGSTPVCCIRKNFPSCEPSAELCKSLHGRVR
jgi:hypothetical protein